MKNRTKYFGISTTTCAKFPTTRDAKFLPTRATKFTQTRVAKRYYYVIYQILFRKAFILSSFYYRALLVCVSVCVYRWSFLAVNQFLCATRVVTPPWCVVHYPVTLCDPCCDSSLVFCPLSGYSVRSVL